MKPLLVLLTCVTGLVSGAVLPGRTVLAPAAVVAVRAMPLARADEARVRVLRDVLVEAGNLTARVALAPDRAGRVGAARLSAARVLDLSGIARWADDDAAAHVALLRGLAAALEDYDLPRIAQLSDQRADAVIVLERRLSTPVIASAGLLKEGR